jgi:16S rRNA (cytidine1402-2'-O)-methyltransferase
VTGLLILCGTPIGNPGDASPRLAEVLSTADIVAAEDTRRLHRLAAALDVKIAGRVVSYYDGNEVARAEQLVTDLADGLTVAVVTDAGMPAVSDPGYRLVAAAAAAGIRVTALPGPSAVTTAIAVSGLPSDRWVFEGFLPRKPGERDRRLAELAGETRTVVLLEAPHRIAASLAAMAAAFGSGRPAAVCRELSKTYEQVLRGGLGELASQAAQEQLRGEITVVIAGAVVAAPALSGPELAAAVADAEASGLTRKEAIAEVVKQTGVARRVVYDAVVEQRHPR